LSDRIYFTKWTQNANQTADDEKKEIDMTDTCPQCGAAVSEGRTCQTVFDEFLALEFTDPDYGAVHMLTVACFMIQHGRYSDTGLVWIEQRLHDYLERGISAAQIRRDAAQETRQDRRDWKVLRQPHDPPQKPARWSVTIVDLADQADSAAHYRAAIERWARATLTEMQALLPG
jgi:hypothetical protein